MPVASKRPSVVTRGGPRRHARPHHPAAPWPHCMAGPVSSRMAQVYPGHTPCQDGAPFCPHARNPHGPRNRSLEPPVTWLRTGPQAPLPPVAPAAPAQLQTPCPTDTPWRPAPATGSSQRSPRRPSPPGWLWPEPPWPLLLPGHGSLQNLATFTSLSPVLVRKLPESKDRDPANLSWSPPQVRTATTMAHGTHSSPGAWPPRMAPPCTATPAHGPPAHGHQATST